MHNDQLFGREPGEGSIKAIRRILEIFETSRGSKCHAWHNALTWDSRGIELARPGIEPLPNYKALDMAEAWKMHFYQRPQLQYLMEPACTVVTDDDAPFYAAGLQFRPNHSNLAFDSTVTNKKRLYIGTTFYAVQNALMGGPLPSYSEELGHGFCERNGIKLRGVYSTPNPSTAKDTYATPHKVFAGCEQYQRVVLAGYGNTDVRIDKIYRSPVNKQEIHPALGFQLTDMYIFTNSPPAAGEMRYTDWNPSLEAEFPARELNWNAGKRSEFQVRNPPMPIEMWPDGSFRVQPEAPALHAQAKSAPKVKKPKMKCDFCGQPMKREELNSEESIMHCANCNNIRPLPEVLSEHRSPLPLQDHQDEPRPKRQVRPGGNPRSTYSKASGSGGYNTNAAASQGPGRQLILVDQSRELVPASPPHPPRPMAPPADEPSAEEPAEEPLTCPLMHARDALYVERPDAELRWQYDAGSPGNPEWQDYAEQQQHILDQCHEDKVDEYALFSIATGKKRSHKVTHYAVCFKTWMQLNISYKWHDGSHTHRAVKFRPKEPSHVPHYEEEVVEAETAQTQAVPGDITSMPVTTPSPTTDHSADSESSESTDRPETSKSSDHKPKTVRVSSSGSNSTDSSHHHRGKRPRIVKSEDSDGQQRRGDHWPPRGPDAPPGNWVSMLDTPESQTSDPEPEPKADGHSHLTKGGKRRKKWRANVREKKAAQHQAHNASRGKKQAENKARRDANKGKKGGKGPLTAVKSASAAASPGKGKGQGQPAPAVRVVPPVMSPPPMTPVIAALAALPNAAAMSTNLCHASESYTNLAAWVAIFCTVVIFICGMYRILKPKPEPLSPVLSPMLEQLLPDAEWPTPPSTPGTPPPPLISAGWPLYSDPQAPATVADELTHPGLPSTARPSPDELMAGLFMLRATRKRKEAMQAAQDDPYPACFRAQDDPYPAYFRRDTETDVRYKKVWYHDQHGEYVYGVPYDCANDIMPENRVEAPMTIYFSNNVAQQKTPVYHAQATCCGLNRVSQVRLAKACNYCINVRRPIHLPGQPASLSLAEQKIWQEGFEAGWRLETPGTDAPTGLSQDYTSVRR